MHITGEVLNEEAKVIMCKVREARAAQNAFLMNKKMPDSSAPPFHDITQEVEDPELIDLMKNALVIEAPPLKHMPLSWRMRKSAAKILSIDFNAKEGEAAWMNGGTEFLSQPTCSHSVGMDRNCSKFIRTIKHQENERY